MYKDVKNQGQIWNQHYQIMNEKLESPKMTHPIAHTPKETMTPLLWGELACLLLSASDFWNPSGSDSSQEFISVFRLKSFL